MLEKDEMRKITSGGRNKGAGSTRSVDLSNMSTGQCGAKDQVNAHKAERGCKKKEMAVHAHKTKGIKMNEGENGRKMKIRVKCGHRPQMPASDRPSADLSSCGLFHLPLNHRVHDLNHRRQSCLAYKPVEVIIDRIFVIIENLLNFR